MLEIQRRRRYCCTVDRLWTAIATSEGLAGWLMDNDFEPTVGHRFEFRTDPVPGFDGIVRAQVLELEAPRRLRLAWSAGSMDTEVLFTVEPIEPGVTELHLAHTGFGFTDLIARTMLGLGWRKLLRKMLTEWLEGQA